MPFKIKLEDVMLGAYKKTSIKIQKICTACEGKGGAQSSVIICYLLELRFVKLAKAIV